MSIKTPRYNLADYESVYEPSEDTFLLLDALEMDLDALHRLNPLNCLEIGSGSGVISTALSKCFKQCTYFTTDVNMDACLATKQTAHLNETNLEAVCMNLANNFRPNQFDLLIFNPPYVVTDSLELLGNGVNRAWAGGRNGREIIDQLLDKIPHILTQNGIFYLLLLKENHPNDVQKRMLHMAYKNKLLLERKILGEHLYVYKFFK